jgi:hypothetical protein
MRRNDNVSGVLSMVAAVAQCVWQWLTQWQLTWGAPPKWEGVPERARRVLEAMPAQDQQLLSLLYGAVQIVNAYGGCLEARGECWGSPASTLPAEKAVIKAAIRLLYGVLDRENIRSWIRALYPAVAESLLAETYHNALRIGYMALPSFISEAEFLLLNRYQNQADLVGLRDLLAEHGVHVVEELARMTVDTEALAILVRIRTEGIQALRDLEAFRDRLRHAGHESIAQIVRDLHTR